MAATSGRRSAAAVEGWYTITGQGSDRRCACESADQIIKGPAGISAYRRDGILDAEDARGNS
jgi:hypothetical protein